MDNNEVFKCSHYNCDKSFVRTKFSFESKTPPINDKDKLEEILEGIVITRLFCMDCSLFTPIKNVNENLSLLLHLSKLFLFVDFGIVTS